MAPSDAYLNGDSPMVKRIKTANGNDSVVPSATGYNSEEDSGDELFAGLPSPVARHFTQPTQIIDRSTLQQPLSSSPAFRKHEEIQIPASSPFRYHNLTSSKPATSGGTVISAMAPAGTTFRPPAGIVRAPVKPAKVIDLEGDDGPQYIGGSSDEESQSAADIKPSTLNPKKISFGLRTVDGDGKAKHVQPSFMDLMKTFQAGSTGRSSAGSSFNSNVGVPHKRPVQIGPERAMPVDLSMDEIDDVDMRRKIMRIKQVYSDDLSITAIRTALIKSKGNVNDAMDLLANQQTTNETSANQLNVIEISDDDTPRHIAIKNIPSKSAPESTMKSQLKAPLASIAQRYSSTQKAAMNPLTAPSTPPKPKRKLIRGRRDPSSPAVPSSSAPRRPSPQQDVDNEPEAVFSDADSNDSGVVSEEEQDLETEDRVLKYLNKCKKEDLVDLANLKDDVADFFLSKRPFRTLDIAREVSNAKELKSGKKSNKAPIGEKIVQTTMDMMSGYEAVDALVAHCERLGKPLTEEMKKWGFDSFGGKAGGELEMVSFEDEDGQRDSGIGTPSSKNSNNGDVQDDDVRIVASRKSKVNFLKKPTAMMDDVVLKDYQLVGLNWLALLYKHGLSCILADDMGLGKTCQVIAFLTHLVEIGDAGPHLVIVPPSTLENWLREFEKFSPGLVIEPYYGSQAEREDIGERILDHRDEVNVVVSTYEFAAKPNDNKFMRKLRPIVCVYDEGHVLKNPKSLKYKGLIRIPAAFRLLLTGTPLQNNLMELAALLAFILPEVFQERSEDLGFIFGHKASTRDASHAALLSAQRIARAKSMLTPFVLRRKKAQVLKHMPEKICRVEFCDMHPQQAEVYQSLQGKAMERAKLRATGEKIPNDGENNPLMQLRKAAIHPMLFRRHFDDAKLVKMRDILRKYEPDEFNQPADKILLEMQGFSDFKLHVWCRLYPCIKKFGTPDLTWMNSGKVEALVRLVKQYKGNGDRVLIFSQFTLVLDVIEAVFETAKIRYTRFDGATKVNERQTLIDNFRDDDSITAFLLSTGAGGTGVNLAFANKVIIFDSSFNPQDDIQAENRAHRVGQTRDVEVVRLITKGTIEEQIYALGQSKLELDSKVAGNDELALKGEEMVAKMLLKDSTTLSTDEKKEVENKPVEPVQKRAKRKRDVDE